MQAVAAHVPDDVCICRDKVGIAEREYRIQMHGRSALRHETGDNSCSRFCLEKFGCELTDRLVGGSLTHANQDHTLSDRHDVSAFQARTTKRLVGVAPPDLEVPTAENGVKLVDRALEQGFRLPRRPIHRIDGYPAVDPARRITLEEGVRNRGNNEFGVTEGLGHDSLASSIRKVVDCDSTYEKSRERFARHFVEPWADVFRIMDPHGVRRDPAIEDELTRIPVVESLGKEILEF